MIALLSLAVQYAVVAAIYLLLIMPLQGQAGSLVFINFIYFPLVLGDAAGEVIGTIVEAAS